MKHITNESMLFDLPENTIMFSKQDLPQVREEDRDTVYPVRVLAVGKKTKRFKVGDLLLVHWGDYNEVVYNGIRYALAFSGGAQLKLRNTNERC